MSTDALLPRLDGLQGKGPRWRAICPAHRSKHRTRTLSIYEPEDGHVLLHCFAGCDVESIVGALGLDLTDLFPPRQPGQEARPGLCKPWRAFEVVDALRRELHVAAVILSDVAEGQAIDEAGRVRAREAIEQIGIFIGELDHAR